MEKPEPSLSSLNILLALHDPSEAIIRLLTPHQVDILPEKTLLSEYVSKKNYHLIFLEEEKEKLHSLRSMDPRVEIFLFGEKNLDIIDALNSGASACFTQPVNMDQLDEAVRKVAELVEVRKETGEIEKLLKNKYTFSGVVGKNPQMLEIFNFIRRIAPYYWSVLISGDTGTGKEAVARALHDTQGANHPFLVCNCGALVENLIESELFGHKKGAFTGAVMDKIGLFETAGEGTLLLDEIGEMSLSFQPHLLRVLENGEFRRLGSNTPLQAKCRVIASTNRDLEAEVKKRNFREDLFFRLTRLTIQLPPLRDRVDDIPLICRHLLNRFNQRTGKVIYGISRPAMTRLMAYPWPGNVRELESVLEKAAILTQKSFINLDDIPMGVSEAKKPAADSLMSLDLLERSHIEKALDQCKGNRTRAAEILKISRRALLRKIEKYHLA